MPNPRCLFSKKSLSSLYSFATKYKCKGYVCCISKKTNSRTWGARYNSLCYRRFDNGGCGKCWMSCKSVKVWVRYWMRPEGEKVRESGGTTSDRVYITSRKDPNDISTAFKTWNFLYQRSLVDHLASSPLQSDLRNTPSWKHQRANTHSSTKVTAQPTPHILRESMVCLKISRRHTAPWRYYDEITPRHFSLSFFSSLWSLKA